MNKFVVDIGLELSSYTYQAEFMNLTQDNVVKNFTDFGLEWEIQFSVTILNETSSEMHNIVYIPGTLAFEQFTVMCFLKVNPKRPGLFGLPNPRGGG